MAVLAIIVATSLSLIAGLHIFWALGGKWAGQIALPKKEDGSLLFSPGPIPCFLVAVILLAMAAFCIVRFVLAFPWMGDSLGTRVLWLLAGVFFLRFIGDFRYVGIFRKVRRTDFGRMDGKLYSPLCGAYSAAFVLMAIS